MALYKNVNGNRIKLSETDESAIRAEWAENDRLRQEEKASNGWRRDRIIAYKEMSTISDQIDIIQKQMQFMIELNQMTATPETQAWLDAIAAIKTNNPKPS